MKTTNLSTGTARKDRLIHEHIHNPYRVRNKLPEPTVCPQCNAVFRAGRWQWVKALPQNAHQEFCEACQRIRDHYPGGEVTLHGASLSLHKSELLHLARNLEKAESARHPLHRIMSIEEHPDRVVINTTDPHLARHIGESVRHAHKGKVNWHFTKESSFVRVIWTPDD